MALSEPMEHAVITYGEMRHLKDGEAVYDQDDRGWVKHGPWWHLNDGDRRLLGTELKRLSEYLYVLRPYRRYTYPR